MGVANQEGEVELREHCLGDDGRVSGLCFGVEWIWCALVSAVDAVWFAVDAVWFAVRCPDTSFDALQGSQRRCNARRLAIGRHEIVDDVLDKQALTLFVGK